MAGGPDNARVPHSIVVCAIGWGQDAADASPNASRFFVLIFNFHS